jgi:hypothetical protein
MKLNEKALAGAHAVIALILYIVCVFLVLVLPGSTMWLFDSWFHGVQLSQLPVQTGSISTVVFGAVTLTVAAWVWGYFIAVFYNRLLR